MKMFDFDETTFTGIKSNIWNRFGGKQSAKLLENERQLQMCVGAKISKNDLKKFYHNGGVKLICSDFDYDDFIDCLKRFYDSSFFNCLNSRFMDGCSGLDRNSTASEIFTVG